MHWGAVEKKDTNWAQDAYNNTKRETQLLFCIKFYVSSICGFLSH